MATSSYLFEHYLSENVLGVELNPSIPTLAEIFKKNGYDTAFFGPWMAANIKDFNRGFDAFDLGTMGLSRYFFGGLKRLTSGRYDPGSAEALTSKAIRWMQKKSGKPFFLWLHYFDAHAPYRPRPPYNRMFVGDGLGTGQGRKPFVASRFLGAGGIPRFISERGISDVDHYIAKYDGAIRYVDGQIGRLSSFLKKRGLYENSAIALTSDHAEYLGEHDLYFCHGGLPLDTLIRVPLIIKPPAGAPEGALTIDRQVQSLDITPTLLGIAGIKHSTPFKGQDISCVFRGEKLADDTGVFFWARHIAALRTPAFKLILLDRDRIIARLGSARSAKPTQRSRKWKTVFPFQLEYLYKEGIPASIFYDLANDGAEVSPKIDRPQEAEGLYPALNDWKGRVSELRGGPSEHFSREVREKLKSLGYIQ